MKKDSREKINKIAHEVTSKVIQEILQVINSMIVVLKPQLMKFPKTK